MVKPKQRGKKESAASRSRKDEEGEVDEELLQSDDVKELMRLVDEARSNRPKDKKDTKKKSKAIAKDDEDDEDEAIPEDEDEEEDENDELSDEERVLRELKTEAFGDEEDDDENDESPDEDELTDAKGPKPPSNHKRAAAKPFVNEAAALRERAAELRLSDFAESLVVSDEVTYDEKINVEEDNFRESRFTEIATRAVRAGRDKLDELKVPHRRPTDFMAEMIKSDDHMAKVKRRLIFEQQKMKTVEARKAAERNKKRMKEMKKQREEESSNKKRKASDIASSFRNREGLDDKPAKKHRSGGDRGGGSGKKGPKPRLGKDKRKSFKGKRGK